MTARASAYDIRFAQPQDLRDIAAMIRELAEFERLSHLCVATDADLQSALFGPTPAAEVLISWKADERVAFALFFHNFSTFLGRRGLWLEDLFVRPQHRRHGHATALLKELARIGVERGCGRFEWAVLEWNTRAIDFYRERGADVLPDWRIVRVAGPALTMLGTPRESST